MNFRDSYLASVLFEAGIINEGEAEKIAKAERRLESQDERLFGNSIRAVAQALRKKK